MANCEKILICGFSGAGKSGLIQELKRTSSDQRWSFHDLDQVIMENQRVKNLETLIKTHGWEKFRLWERQALEGQLKDEGRVILSLGGGALSPMIYDLYRPMRKVSFCYLHAPFNECWDRLHLVGSEPRPLVKLGKDELYKIYLERQKIFSQIPWKLENLNGTDMGELAQRFWEELNQF
jgi:shikimate kinase